jgi:hypothetical protein
MHVVVLHAGVCLCRGAAAAHQFMRSIDSLAADDQATRHTEKFEKTFIV